MSLYSYFQRDWSDTTLFFRRHVEHSRGDTLKKVNSSGQCSNTTLVSEISDFLLLLATISNRRKTVGALCYLENWSVSEDFNLAKVPNL